MTNLDSRQLEQMVDKVSGGITHTPADFISYPRAGAHLLKPPAKKIPFVPHTQHPLLAVGSGVVATGRTLDEGIIGITFKDVPDLSAVIVAVSTTLPLEFVAFTISNTAQLNQVYQLDFFAHQNAAPHIIFMLKGADPQAKIKLAGFTNAVLERFPAGRQQSVILPWFTSWDNFCFIARDGDQNILPGSYGHYIQ